MLACVCFYSLAKMLLLLVVTLQIFEGLTNQTPNKRIRAFGAQLSGYIYQLLIFLTFNNEACPFPFSDWPETPPLPPADEGGN